VPDPLLSVCIPTFDMGAWVGAAVESALAIEPAELVDVVVVENASTDDSREVLARYVDHPRVRVSFETEHVGMAANWNRAMRFATGEWCVMLCADDRIQPEFLSNLMPFTADPSVVLIGQACRVFEGTPPRPTSVLGGERETEYAGVLGLRRVLSGDPFPFSATAFRRSAFEQVGGFRPDVAGIMADWDLWIRLVALTGRRGIATGVVGGEYYWDRGSAWKRVTDRGEEIAMIGSYVRRIGPWLEVRRVERWARGEVARRSVAKAVPCMARGELAPARTRLRAGVRYGVGAWRARAVVEWALLSIGVGAPLARWRATARPGGKLRDRASRSRMASRVRS
jgi:glycosyltransferase involved in cell wall biosynthesis